MTEGIKRGVLKVKQLKFYLMIGWVTIFFLEKNLTMKLLNFTITLLTKSVYNGHCKI